MSMIKSIAMSVFKSLMTEKFIKEMIVELLKWLAEKTENKVDDKMVKMVEYAMNDEKVRTIRHM